MNRHIEDLAPTALIRASNEDIKAGDDIRARIHFLSTQNQSIVTQTQFADAKAAALMTVMSLVALRSPFSESARLDYPLDTATYGMLVVSIVMCLWAVIPRYPRASVCAMIVKSDKFTWVGLSSPSYTGDMHDSYARDCDLLDMAGALARSNVGGSRVLLKKFKALRWAFLAGIAAIVLMALRYIPPEWVLPGAG